MKKEQITKLLERYFDGETSSLDEDILNEYFAEGNIDPEFERYKQMFEYFSFEKDSLKAIKPRVRKKIYIPNFRKMSFSLASVAAAAVLLLAIVLHEGSGYTLMVSGNKVIDQELAIQIASEQLEKISIMSSVAGKNVGKLKKVAVIDNYFGSGGKSDNAMNTITSLFDKFQRK